MYCRIYIRIDDIVEASNIINAFPEQLKGEIKGRKAIIDKEVKIVSQYWVSSIKELEMTNAQQILCALKELLAEYEIYFTSLKYQPSVSIVLKYSSPDEVGGIFLDSQLIKVLAKINSSIDIDEYVD